MVSPYICPKTVYIRPALPSAVLDTSVEESKQCRTVVQEGGSEALDEWLEAEKERNLPEFKKRRPKYYYYFEWMKERISQHCGELPAPVLDKLLNIEAGELDTLLNYPKGIQAKVGSSPVGVQPALSHSNCQEGTSLAARYLCHARHLNWYAWAVQEHAACLNLARQREATKDNIAE